MCGIAGVMTIHGDSSDVRARVLRMTDALRHRGPDDAGVEIVTTGSPVVALGHRRLSIIDVSAAGHQPMRDPDNDCWITFNGEIYNFRQLRSELQGRGQNFRSATDTEVILKAYAEWGPDCVRRLRGIFAFGIWDVRRQLLLLARDQMGVKPLYYTRQLGILGFASEVRALLASDLVARKLNAAGMTSFLEYGSVQEPHTLVQGIDSLPPGSLLIERSGTASVQRYWGLPPAEAVASAPPADLLERIRAKLQDAVSDQLVADVPLGAFLSGGIDSTAIAALMRRAGTHSPRTFSIVFEEERYDERVFSRAAAKYIGTEHTELLLRGEEVRTSLPAALGAFDQPSMDGLNTYFVSRITREAGLTVALSGVGGDELFGGYDSYRKAIFAERLGTYLQRVPTAVRRTFADAISLLPSGEGSRRLAQLLRTTRHPYFVSRQVFTSPQISTLAPQTVADPTCESNRFEQLRTETASYDPINRASAFELQTYMLSTLLRDTDQMSMAHALEVRVPLIDHELVEFMFTVPGPCKVDPKHPKPLLTKSLNGALPNECVFRPKRGFELPFATWLRESLATEMRDSFLAPSSANSWPFDAPALAQLWNTFDHGKIGWSRVWAVFVLRRWLEQHEISA